MINDFAVTKVDNFSDNSSNYAITSGGLCNLTFFAFTLICLAPKSYKRSQDEGEKSEVVKTWKHVGSNRSIKICYCIEWVQDLT